MVMKKEIDAFLDDENVPRNLRNRLKSVIKREYGREGTYMMDLENEMSSRVNGAYFKLLDEYRPNQ